MNLLHLKGWFMSYAMLMVYVDADDAPERRVRLAAGLADKFSATLTGLSAVAIEPFVAEGVVIEDMTEAAVREASEKLTGRDKWFRAVAGADHRKLEWRSVMDFPTETLAREARSADLVVIGQTRGTGDIYNAFDPGVALLKTGRPILVVPEDVGSLRADHVVIGWKDARESRRAVQDALPFLHEAARVTVVEICESGEQAAARMHVDDVASFLARHRIRGDVRILVRQEGSGASQLIKLAQDEGADLIVSGAYGHSRLGEWIFGGMTRDLLAFSPFCCLMSH